jgi:archaetidylinositol phosphate synthase
MPKPNKSSGIEKHKRVNDILLASIEKPALAWLVKVMPGWVTPDMLTIFGFLASILIGVSYVLTNVNKNFLWLASLGFILNWFGDSLDGSLARYRKIERPRYGFFIDHAVDIISEVFIFLGLAFSAFVDFKVGVLALLAYLCMTNLVFLITSVEGVFQISYGRLGPTEARVIAMSANTIIYFIGNPVIQLPFGAVHLYDLIVIGVIILLVTFFVYTTLSHGIALSRSDRAAQKKP